VSARNFTISSSDGLHLQPIKAIINVCNKYPDTQAAISCKGSSVQLDSPMNVLVLGITSGSEITITTKGKEEDKLLEEIGAIIENQT